MTRVICSSSRALTFVTKPATATLYTTSRPLNRHNDPLASIASSFSHRFYATKYTSPSRVLTKPALTNLAKPSQPVDQDLYGDGINPPLTTLPPPLSVPEKDDKTSTPIYWYRVGRAYGKFYITGVKQTYWNYKKAKGLRARIHASNNEKGEDNYPPRRWLGLVPPPLLLDIEVFMRREGLLRSQLQLLVREREDVKKLPLFAVLVALFGEWLPLIVPFIPGRVPKTCRIPKQVNGMREAGEERRKESFRKGISPPEGNVIKAIRYRVGMVRATEDKVRAESRRNKSDDDIEAEMEAGEAGDVMALRVQPANWLAVEMTESLDREQLTHVSTSLGLHGKIWERLGLVGGSSPLTPLLKFRVAKRLHYLNLDDELLVKDKTNNFEALSATEVEIACEERGIDVTNRSDVALRADLSRWLEGRAKDNGYGEEVTKMLFKRPNSW